MRYYSVSYIFDSILQSFYCKICFQRQSSIEIKRLGETKMDLLYIFSCGLHIIKLTFDLVSFLI